MAFTGSVFCTSFKKELGQAIHNMDTAGDVFKIALYTDTANIGLNTPAYTATDEASGAGYSAGGATLTNQAASTGTSSSGIQTAFFGWQTVTFSTVSLSCRGALIYNSSKANRAVAVLDFGITITKAAADLVVTMPVFDVNNALIRI